METQQAIKARKSCRSYLDKSVPRELVEALIDAGRRAPSANNLQPVEYIVVKEQEMLNKLALATDYGRFIRHAPVCIVVVAKNTKYYLEDGCAAVENILLAAADSGLGACWVAGDKKKYADEILDMLNVPPNFNLIALLPLGWPKDGGMPHEKKPLRKVLHWEKF